MTLASVNYGSLTAGRRVGRLSFAWDLLLEALQALEGKDRYHFYQLPRNARVVGARVDPLIGIIHLYVESPDFALVLDGEPPQYELNFQWIKPQSEGAA